MSIADSPELLFAAYLSSGASFFPASPGLKQQLHSYIQHLQGVLDNMEGSTEPRKNALEATLRQHQALLCPIHSLPTDVLLDIFHLIRAPEPPYYQFKISPQESTQKLITVCRRWRNLCLASPALWNPVDVSNSTMRTQNALELALKRARGPSFAVELLLPVPLTYHPVIQESVPFLTSLTIKGLVSSFATFPTLRMFAKLQQLSIVIFPRRRPPAELTGQAAAGWVNPPIDSTTALKVVSDCPQLRRLCCAISPTARHDSIVLDPSQVNMVWSRLTEIDVHSSSSSDLVRMLRLCINLQKFLYRGLPSHFRRAISDWPPGLTAVLPRLTTLELCNMSPGLPRCLICPSLETLVLRGLWDIEDLTRMLNNAGRVRHLKLQDLIGHPSASLNSFRLLLFKFDNVESLVIPNNNDQLGLLVPLLRPQARVNNMAGMFFPRLRSIVLVQHGLRFTTARELGAALCARAKGHESTGLKKVTVRLFVLAAPAEIREESISAAVDLLKLLRSSEVQVSLFLNDVRKRIPLS
ncbi:hypothetical protein CYLTODRAFT_444076 [Cylindrobasidium torrendii FP15055 ss-10]|uniref:Uncharacterized protein n=1 Tax=Cylindrobasidium torrendii FP15055 ss-10 TaxID=1314674 RepID=A0A0D7B9Z9_9AGAR|nr:hypothetical protein CYLTODRAFT_444076 [Cylindrobasidium torrendii FP15055 ss-10]